jgi:hypothetical protein
MARALLILLVVALPACKSDPVQKDLLRYLNGVTQITPASDEAVREFDAMGAMDAAAASSKLDEIIGSYQKYVTAAKALQPSTGEVQKLHALLVEMSDDQLQAFTLAKDAYRTNGPDAMKKVNEQIDAAKAARQHYLDERASLTKRHHVELK